MKKIRKLFALTMVLAILSGTLVLPASAAVGDNEVAEPNAAYIDCPKCSAQARVVSTGNMKVVDSHDVISCDYITNDSHTHKIQMYYSLLSCPNCGSVQDGISYRVYCVKSGLYIS